MHVLPHLPSPMPSSEHRSVTRTSTQRPPALSQPSEFLEIFQRPEFRDGLDVT